MRYCGVDVSAKPGNQQLVTLHERRAPEGGMELVATFYEAGDVERVARTIEGFGRGEAVVAIDAPSGPRLDLLAEGAPLRAELGLPDGRYERMRVCDALLFRRGLPLYPVPASGQTPQGWEAWIGVGFELFAALSGLGLFRPVPADAHAVGPAAADRRAAHEGRARRGRRSLAPDGRRARRVRRRLHRLRAVRRPRRAGRRAGGGRDRPPGRRSARPLRQPAAPRPRGARLERARRRGARLSSRWAGLHRREPPSATSSPVRQERGTRVLHTPRIWASVAPLKVTRTSIAGETRVRDDEPACPAHVHEERGIRSDQAPRGEGGLNATEPDPRAPSTRTRRAGASAGQRLRVDADLGALHADRSAVESPDDLGAPGTGDGRCLDLGSRRLGRVRRCRARRGGGTGRRCLGRRIVAAAAGHGDDDDEQQPGRYVPLLSTKRHVSRVTRGYPRRAVPKRWEGT